MSTLKSDGQGFLIGQAIEVAAKELQLLRRIADDVRAIRRHLLPDGDRRPAVDRVRGTNQGTNRSDKHEAVGTPGKREQGRTGGSADRNATVTVAAPKNVTPAIPGLAAQRLLASTGAVSLPAKKTRQLNGVARPDAVPVVEVRARDDRGRFLSPTASAAGVATPSGRDDKGRFTAGSRGDGGASLDMLKDIRDRIGGLSAGGTEEVDPSVKAASEVAEVAASAVGGVKAAFGGLRALGSMVASPVGRMFGAGGGHDAPTPWFRRLWRELRLQRREQTTFHRAELRVLKDIEGKPPEGRGGLLGAVFSMLGMLGSLLGGLGATLAGALVATLAKIPGLAMLGKLLPRVLPTVPSRTGAGSGKPGMWTRAKERVSGWVRPAADAGPQKPGLLQRAKNRVGGWMAKAGGLVPDAIKPAGRLASLRAGLGRVPVLGAALTALGMGAGVYTSESGGGTRAEKDRRTGQAVGRGVGSVGSALLLGSTGAKVGAALGVALGPVGIAIGAGLGGIVGAAAGAFFGDKAGEVVGDKVGGWVTELRNADIPGKLSAFADGVSSFVAGLAEKAGAKLGQAKAAIQDKGMDISTAAKRGYEAASGKPAQYTPAELERLRQNAASTIRNIDSGRAPKQGFTERLAESAGRGAGTIGRVATSAADGLQKRFGGAQFTGFGADVDAHIAEASQRYGIPEDVLRGFVKMEGGWTGKMSPTGAIGTGQFIKPTWDGLAKTKEGQQIGMTPIGSRFRTSADPRFDKRTNTLATGLLAKQNADLLRRHGLPVTGENLYMLHNIGPGVLPALKGSNAVTAETQTAMRHNGLREGMTPTDFVAHQKSRFSQHYAQANAAPSLARVGGALPVSASPVATPYAARMPQIAPAVTAHASPAIKGAASAAATAQQAPRVPEAQAAPAPNAQSQKPGTVVVVPSGRPLAGRDVPERPMAHLVTGGYSTGRA